MKYYINRVSGEIFAYESDGSQDDFIKAGLEPLTDKEWESIRKAREDALAPTPEQILQDVNAERDRLLAVAGLRIAPLQYAVDLNTATDTEMKNLKIWKQYSVDVNRVCEQVGYPALIDWPTQPS